MQSTSKFQFVFNDSTVTCKFAVRTSNVFCFVDS